MGLKNWMALFVYSKTGTPLSPLSATTFPFKSKAFCHMMLLCWNKKTSWIPCPFRYKSSCIFVWRSSSISNLSPFFPITLYPFIFRSSCHQNRKKHHPATHSWVGVRANPSQSAAPSAHFPLRKTDQTLTKVHSTASASLRKKPCDLFLIKRCPRANRNRHNQCPAQLLKKTTNKIVHWRCLFFYSSFRRSVQIFLGICRPKQDVNIDKVKGDGASKLSAHKHNTTDLKLPKAHGQKITWPAQGGYRGAR